MTGEVQELLVGLVQGAGAAVVAVLALLIGFIVVFTLPKLRRSGRASLVVKSLDERLGTRQKYFPPDAPRGTVDQLGAGTRQASAA
jgi:hypothetical protein